MTFNEVKKLLENWRSAEIKALRLKRRLKEIKEDYDGLRAQNYDTMPKPIANSPNSIQERVTIKLETAEESWALALEEVYDIEDRIAEAIKTLTDDEQAIITGYYLEDKTHDKLADECFYSRRSICYIKKRAINKMSKVM